MIYLKSRFVSLAVFKSITMLKLIFVIVTCLSFFVRSELIGEKYANYRSDDLTPIVIKGNYSTKYTFNINATDPYLFIYEYLPVSVLLI